MGNREAGEGWGVLPPDNRRANGPGDLSIRQSRGLPAPPGWVSKTTALVAALTIFVLLAAGCGGGEGVASGATVTAYVEASLCRGAKEELARRGNRAGDVRVRAICLPNPRNGKEIDLAVVGANARRATEDSTAVAFLETPSPKVGRFTHPILESAQIAWFANRSGGEAMATLLRAIESDADPGNLRSDLYELRR